MSESLNNSDAFVTITVDGVSHNVDKSLLLIEALEELGVFIPRFCYHPRMKPVGMCRMCLVEVSSPRGFSLQPACFIKVADSMEVKTTTEAVKKAQVGVLEFLLINHPLDCPVCDKGGECPLQDQAYSYGPGESRFVEEKRHWAKPISISTLIDLDRERCIQCGRCTRFASEIAHDPLIDFYSRGDRIEVSYADGYEFNSVYSGNIVQICPVGALTAKPYRFKARPWDLEQSESSCTFCSIGCRVSIQSSANRVVRVLGIDLDSLNQSWLCDKGRFGYLALESPNRILTPKIKINGKIQDATASKAAEQAAKIISETKAHSGASSIGFLGGWHLTLEEAYIWSRLIKSVIGSDNCDCLVTQSIDPAFLANLKIARIDEIDTAKLCVVIGGDLEQNLPILNLRLMQAVENHNVKLIEFSSYSTKLSSFATKRYDLRDLYEFVDNFDAVVSDIDLSGITKDEIVFIINPDPVGEISSIERIVFDLYNNFKESKFLVGLRQANIFGAISMGLVPGFLPGTVSIKDFGSYFSSKWGFVPDAPGKNTKEILAGTINKDIKTLILLGCDPLEDYPYLEDAEKAIEAAEHIIYIGSLMTPVARKADVVIPTRMWAEKDGTFMTLDKRLMRLSQRVTGPLQALSDWEIASLIAYALGEDFNYASVWEILDEISSLVPGYSGVFSSLFKDNNDNEGIFLPLESQQVRIRKKLDPIEVPGIMAVETQGAPMTGAVEVVASERYQQSALQVKIPELKTPDSEAFYPASDGIKAIFRKRLYDKSTMILENPYLSMMIEPVKVLMNPNTAKNLGLNQNDELKINFKKNAIGQLTAKLVIDENVKDSNCVIDWKTGDKAPYYSKVSAGTIEVEVAKI